MKIQSYSDIITNSSSELFVFNSGQTINEIISELDKIYTGWRDDYCLPYYANDDPDSIDMYVERLKQMPLFIRDFDIKRISYHYYKKWSRHHKKKAYYNRPKIKRMFKEFPNLINWKLSDYNPELSYGHDFAKMIGTTPERLYSNWDRYNPVASYNNPDFDRELKYSDEADELIKQYAISQNCIFLSDGVENPDSEWKYKDALIALADDYYLKF